MVLWVEALENCYFRMDMRSTIIETLLLFFCIQGSLMDLTSLCEKPNRRTHHVTFATREKLRWFVCTLAPQLIALRSGNSNLGLDHIGSQMVENHVGNTRSTCHGDHRAVIVTHQVSRFELGRHLLRDLCIERHIAKRVNLGGASLKSGSQLNFHVDGNPSDFAIECFSRRKFLSRSITPSPISAANEGAQSGITA
jgi:hypothetical protein